MSTLAEKWTLVSWPSFVSADKTPNNTGIDCIDLVDLMLERSYCTEEFPRGTRLADLVMPLEHGRWSLPSSTGSESRCYLVCNCRILWESVDHAKEIVKQSNVRARHGDLFR